MADNEKPQWELVADAVLALGGQANRHQVWEYLKRSHPDIPFSTVTAELNSVSVNSQARTSYNTGREPRRTDSGNRYDRLFKVGSGAGAHYVPYDPKTHGVWEIYPDPAATSTHKTSIRRVEGANTAVTVTLTEGAIKPGNTFFPIKAFEGDFFPPSLIRAKDPDAPAVKARFTTDAGIEFQSDIYRSSTNTGYLHNRAAASDYYAARGAKGGDVLRYERTSDGSYHITLLPAAAGTGSAGPQNPAAQTETTMTLPINKILFGPPGTGKTYHTVNEALRILDPQFLAANEGNRPALKERYDQLVAERRIRFVTFHQSFSYEDFVEGIRADAESGQLQYRVQPGVFREICEDASGAAQVASEIGVRDDARIWKISIDGTGQSSTRDHCFAHGEARIGWGGVGDLRNERLADVPEYASLGDNDRSTLRLFSREIEPGDVLLCIGSENTARAIGVVQGEYHHDPAPPDGVRKDFVNVLPVKWLDTTLDLDIRSINGGRKFTLKTVYELTRFGWSDLVGLLEENQFTLRGIEAPRSRALPHVLIIDEINRGNVSRIFGELITLIESSKRKGADEAMEVVLPYSRNRFSVPANVHLIGTMNTADRSLAGLDVALRRRFDFVEMMPDIKALRGIRVAGIPIDQLLSTMNRRIEVLLGRDYMLGHAYFMKLQDTPDIEALAGIFRNKVLPLLQEYFFEDWQKIEWVLNDHRKHDSALKFIRQDGGGMAELFGDEELPREGKLWSINRDAFGNPAAYMAIIEAPQPAKVPQAVA